MSATSGTVCMPLRGGKFLNNSLLRLKFPKKTSTISETLLVDCGIELLSGFRYQTLQWILGSNSLVDLRVELHCGSVF